MEPEEKLLRTIYGEEVLVLPGQLAELRAVLGEVMASLNDRERKVLTFRFGLEDGQSRTLEEVSKEFGVSRERIRQIEAKALRQLRHPSRSRRLKVYLGGGGS